MTEANTPESADLTVEGAPLTCKSETAVPGGAADELAAFASPTRANEPVRVIVWRREYATRLGFDAAQAAALSLDQTDLHAIDALTSNGCTPALALAIVA